MLAAQRPSLRLRAPPLVWRARARLSVPPRVVRRAPRRAFASAEGSADEIVLPPPPPVPNPLGVHALVFSGGWSEPEARRAAEGARDAGYDILEIPLLDPSSVDPAMTKRVLDEHGLVPTTSLGLRFDADVSSEDPEVVRRGEELLLDALDVTAEMGARYMCGILYSALGKYPAPCSALGYRNAVDAIKRVAKAARARGVTLGLEIVNRYETNVLNTAEQCVAFLDAVDEPNVKAHLDSYHCNIEERSARQAVLTLGADRLGYVHVGESHRGRLGTGSVDFVGLFWGLAEIGYEGPVVFESFSDAVVSDDLSAALCVWRSTWGEGEEGEVAEDARKYVLERIRAAEIAKDPNFDTIGDWF